MSLPFLDMRVLKQNPKRFVEQLRSACHNVGFFLLRHDLPPGLAERQLSEARKFFLEPLENKRSISYEDNPAFRGYMEFGVENTSGAADFREQVEYASEQPGGDRTALPPYERLRGMNPWPDHFQPALRLRTNEYVDAAVGMASRLRSALCLSLGLDGGALDPLFGDAPHWAIKLVSYPPVEDAGCSGGTQGVGAHTDSNFLTLVLQDEVGGLQVFSEGKWLDVPPTAPDVLVCNLGEQTEILSNGYFLATPHRVLRNSSGKTRTSVPLFYNPRLDARISPVLPTVGESSLPWERPDRNKKHWRMKNNSMLDTVGDNTFKSLARSHPAVFGRHHRDLCLLEDGQIVHRGGS